MSEITAGDIYISKKKVTKELLASSMGSGDIAVFATPAMVALMENAAMLCIADKLDFSQTSVGVSISTSHIKATALNSDVEAVATVEVADGRKISFSIVARDGGGVIGEALHERVIVDRDKFLSKL